MLDEEVRTELANSGMPESEIDEHVTSAVLALAGWNSRA